MIGAFRNDGDDGDRNDGDDGDDGDNRTGITAYAGARSNSLLAQALWRTRGDLTNGFPGIGSPAWTDKPLEGKDIFGRWSPDVRARQYAFELLSGLHFVGDKEGEEAALVSVTLGRDKKVGVSEPLVELKRPDFDKDKGKFEEELGKVMRKAADLRSERMPEILTQVHIPYPFFAMLLNLQPGRHGSTYELMSAVFDFSSTVVMQFKNHLRVRRPADRSPLVQPVLLTPGHGSFPAGHATQCHFVATVLKALVGKALGDDLGKQLDLLADRIADNRVIAGLHYEADNQAGAKLGIALARYLIQRAADAPHSALGWFYARASGEWQKT